MKKLVIILSVLTSLVMLFAAVSFAEDVTEEEKARILTRGYDISEFTVIDDTADEVIISDLAETQNPFHLMGQAKFTGGSGTMTLEFEGNAVGVIIEKGAYTIFIDDEEIDKVWASSSSAPQIVFYTEDLDNTDHNITVRTEPELATEKTGENYSVIEGFFVQTVPGKGSATGGNSEFDPTKQDISLEERNKIITGEYDLKDYIIIDDTAAGVVQSGLSSTSNDIHLNGSAFFTGGNGSVTYTFEGTSVGVIVEKGGFEVLVDGNNKGQFTLKPAGGPSVLCLISGLEPGTHTIEVKISASLATEGTGESWSVFEGFFIQREPGKEETVITTEPTEEKTEEPVNTKAPATDKPDPTSEPDTSGETVPSTGDDTMLPVVLAIIAGLALMVVFTAAFSKKRT